MQAYFIFLYTMVPGLFVLTMIRNNYLRQFIKTSIIVVLTLFTGMRNISVGTDSAMYGDYFLRNWDYIQWIKGGTEIGFSSIIKLIQLIGLDNYLYFFIVFSLIFNVVVINAIYKISKNIPLSIVIFMTFSDLYIFSFNVMRQSIAVAFVMLSIYYMFESKNRKMYLMLVLAVCFHYSAICAFIFPVAYRMIEKRPFILYLIAAFLIVMFTLITSQLYVYLSLITGADRYTAYNQMITSATDPKKFMLDLFLLICFVCCFLYQKINSKKENFILFLFFCFTCCSFCITFLGLRYEGAGRVIWYFSFSSIFLFPIVINNSKSMTKMLYSLVLSCMLLLYTTYMMNKFNPHEILPYSVNPYVDQIF